MDEVTGQFRILHNKELCDLYKSPSIVHSKIKVTKRQTCSSNGERKKCVQHLEKKFLGKQPLGRLRSRWEYNIKTDTEERICEDQEWLELAQGHAQWQALVLVVLKFWVVLPES
jgi:hypothetical protein